MNAAAIRSLALGIAVAIGPATFAQGQQDFSAVEIKTTKLGPNFYMLEGSGGAMGALVGPDGVFVVDSQYAQLTDKLVAAIGQVSNGGRIRYMVNTHVHPDHTGGNENFAKLGVTLLSRDELRTRLAVPGRGGPPPAASLPILTYRDRVTVHMNGENVQLIPVPAAHTDGDTMVYFPASDVIMIGDFFRSIQYPNIDRANGGSLQGMLNGLSQAVNLAGPATKIIPGHGPVVDKTAVAANRDMIVTVRDRVAKLVAQGQTQEQVVAAKLLADFDTKIQQAGTTGDRFIGQLYAELKAAK
jgi:glyoxylase-like metal-dependent hydrolase (beta-lactamase superfamily II)